MEETEVIQHLTETFAGTTIVTVDGNHFFFYGEDRMMPFATLMTNDINDQASPLNRPGVFRLNIGVGKKTYRSLFNTLPSSVNASGGIETGRDFTALDQLLPHPVYAPQSWVCVLNPSATTFQTVRFLLAEACEIAVRRQKKRNVGE